MHPPLDIVNGGGIAEVSSQCPSTSPVDTKHPKPKEPTAENGAVEQPDPKERKEIPSSFQAAHTLFGPVLYQHYLGWQACIYALGGAQFYGAEATRVKLFEARYSDSIGNLPSVHHYAHFIEFMETHGSQTIFAAYKTPAPPTQPCSPHNPLRTLSCGHRLHPGSTLHNHALCPYCLICHINAALSRIDAARSLYDRATAPQPVWNLLKALWNYQKKEWANKVALLEEMAAREEEWEAEQCESGVCVEREVEGVVRCREVVREAFHCVHMAAGWEQMFLPRGSRGEDSRRARSRIADGRLSRCGFVDPRVLLLCAGDAGEDDCVSPMLSGQASSSSPARCRSPSLDATASMSTQSSHKRVVFAQCVSEQTPARHRRTFHRGSPHYTPGKYTCREGCEYIDTSRFRCVDPIPDDLETRMLEDEGRGLDGECEGQKDGDDGKDGIVGIGKSKIGRGD